MAKKQRLELTWIGKDNRPQPEPRILIEEPALSYRSQLAAPNLIPRLDNLLIKGDNLLALKAIEAEYSGKIKCIFIDPPYNTWSAFTHYEDGLEHSLWLSLMRDRLEVLLKLLSEEGSLWITIDDNEAHYLKILCDEIFGRANFVSTVIWQKLYTIKNSARFMSDMHEYILIYSKSIDKLSFNLLPRSAKLDQGYSNPDNDPRGAWTTNAIQARNFYSQGSYEIKSPSGQVFKPPAGTFWRVSRDTFDNLQADNRVWWGKNGSAVPRIKKFLSEAKQGVIPATIWFHDDVGTNAEAKIETRDFSSNNSDADVFTTPKPERLIKRVLEIATNPGDLVLDSFAGSGTTGAVAQKMGRRWIMVEIGDHADTHIVPRMRKVIDGKDPGGVTEATAWHGGGGFRYCRLAPSLLSRDCYGQWVIAKEYQPEMLAEAVCKLMGFAYSPSREATTYWRHGHSTENDFIFVTTQSMTYESLAKLSEEVGEEHTLLVACRAYAAKDDAFPNITPKKIPLAVLAKCEWGRDDYSLAVRYNAEPEAAADDEPTSGIVAPKSKRSRAKPVAGDAAPSLFGEDA